LETGCLAADLETAQLAEVCAERGLPMLSVRCISDALEDDLPVPADVLLNPQTGRPNPFMLFRYLVSHPSCVTGFGNLLKNSRRHRFSLRRDWKKLPQHSGWREALCLNDLAEKYALSGRLSQFVQAFPDERAGSSRCDGRLLRRIAKYLSQTCSFRRSNEAHCKLSSTAGCDAPEWLRRGGRGD
jgi:hypothetical protein